MRIIFLLSFPKIIWLNLKRWIFLAYLILFCLPCIVCMVILLVAANLLSGFPAF